MSFSFKSIFCDIFSDLPDIMTCVDEKFLECDPTGKWSFVSSIVNKGFAQFTDLADTCMLKVSLMFRHDHGHTKYKCVCCQYCDMGDVTYLYLNPSRSYGLQISDTKSLELTF